MRGYRKRQRYAAMCLILAVLLRGCTADSVQVYALENAEETDKEEAEKEETKDEEIKEEDNMEETDPDLEDTENRFPEWKIESVINDAGNTVTDSEGMYYFRGFLMVSIQVEEETTEENAAVTAVIRRDGQELLHDGGYFLDTLYDSGVYVYTIETEDGIAGSENITIAAEKVCDPPRISLQYTEKPADIYGKLYFMSDPEAVLRTEAPAGIYRITYSSEEEDYQTLYDCLEEGAYSYGKNTDYEVVLSETESFTELLTEMEDGAYSWRFQVTDVLGESTETEMTFLVDKTAPEENIFVSFASDGTNPAVSSDTGIMDFVRAVKDRWFGKTKIEFDLYVRDGIISEKNGYEPSGIDVKDLLEQITVADGRAEISELYEAGDGMASFEYEGVLQTGYVHIKGIMTALSDSDDSVKERLSIRRLKDRAGNVAEGTLPENITGTTVLYFDRTSPVLSADYRSGNIDETCGRVFYQGDTKIGLRLTEDFYSDFAKENGEPATPKVRMGGSAEAEKTEAEWVTEDTGAYTELTFSALPEAGEAEYGFTVEYQDGSGNLLEADNTCAGNTDQGVYISYPVVIDNKAPELTAFVLNGVSKGQTDGMDLYQNVEGEDVIFSFAIDDHETYWNPEKVKLSVTDLKTGEVAAEVCGNELRWDISGRSHQAEYGFDGEEDGEVHSYEARLFYEDRAGNHMIGKGELEESLTEGVYRSEPFMLDHQAPVFDISFNAAGRLVHEETADPSQDLTEHSPQTGYTAYYKETVRACFSIQESSAVPVYEGMKLTGLQDFWIQVTKEDGTVFCPAVTWKKRADIYEGTFNLEGEGRYRIAAGYRDPAGNAMVSGRTEGSRWDRAVSEDGRYESVLLVVDRTAPVIRISCVDTSKEERSADNICEKENRAYYSEPVYLKLEVEDCNLRIHELLRTLDKVRVSDREGKPVHENSLRPFLAGMNGTEIRSGTFICYLPLLTEAVYDFAAGCEDLAGNQADGGMKRIAVDRTCPELEISCSVERTGFLDAVRFGDWHCLFADSKVMVTVQAEDMISGIRMICCTLQEEAETVWKKEICFDPGSSRAWEFTVPAEKQDFKGTVMVETWDWSGNYTVREWKSIVESAGKHADTGRIWIETDTVPGRTVGGIDYYRTDVKFRLMAEDTYSGLKHLTCKGGETLNYHINFMEESIYTYMKELVLKADEHNRNEVPVRADYQDRAGHTETLEQLYNIDIDPPVLEVVYDNHQLSEGGLYDRSRTAEISIRERNLSLSDVEFVITNTDGEMPLIGEWEETGEGDERLHVCRILFMDDGDYTFTVNVTDLAGNRTEYGRTDEFVIDQTTPVLTVSYSDDVKEQEYYDHSRRAMIDIQDRHFDASLVQVSVEARGANAPSVSGWSQDGDHYRAFVDFKSDGEYLWGVTGMDLAGNEMEAYGMDYFVIDQTAPELTVSGVEHRSANNGAIMPDIRCMDTNYAKGSLEVRLEGVRQGLLDANGTRSQSETTEELQMEDFAYVPEADDLYRLSAKACDLAGNESVTEVMFSVNRFGSVYTLDDKTELLAGYRGTCYTNEEPDIIVTETNADTLEFQEITCSLNGQLMVLEEGKDYFVHESGTEESWKQYIYTIPKKNFVKEGAYVLTIYSEDRAKNASDNHMKGKKIEFVVDKTSPSILLSGLEDGGRYRERSRKVTLDVQDNVKTAEVKVIINGIVSTYSASEVSEQNGRITLMAGSDNQWQSIRVTACDAAGNSQELKERRFLITPNLLVQFFMNRKLFYGSMGVLVIVWAGVWQTLFRRRNRRQQLK